uniref:Rab-GAP TBC domain-containing protein n=1 Tax=Pavo cristatus TaxID=9049 RepID=A0A8C9FV07_PAVCR
MFIPFAFAHSKEWEELFVNNNYLATIRLKGINGQLRSSRFRSVCWKLFLEVLPQDRSQWIKNTSELRTSYNKIKEIHITNPRKAGQQDLIINNPLSQDEGSLWNKFFQDKELRAMIEQDVTRTYQLLYKQVMKIYEEMKVLLNPEYLEHDAYAMFTRLMKTAEHWFSTFEHDSQKEKDVMITPMPFARPQDLGPSIAIVTKVNQIQDQLLKKHDIELYMHLNRLEIAPQIYGLDGMDMLVLISSNYQTCLGLLMHYPPIGDVHSLILRALFLRDPKVRVFLQKFHPGGLVFLSAIFSIIFKKIATFLDNIKHFGLKSQSSKISSSPSIESLPGGREFTGSPPLSASKKDSFFSTISRSRSQSKAMSRKESVSSLTFLSYFNVTQHYMLQPSFLSFIKHLYLKMFPSARINGKSRNKLFKLFLLINTSIMDSIP